MIQQFLDLINSHPLFMLAAVILAVAVVVSVLKSLFRLALILIVILICAMVAFNVSSPGELLELGKERISTELKEELQATNYTIDDKKNFTLSTKSLSITYQHGDRKATVSFKDQSFEMDLATLQQYIPHEEIRQLIETELEQTDESVEPAPAT